MIASRPRYRLRLSSPLPVPEVWILLSQHITNKDRSLDDIALHIFEEHGPVPEGGKGRTISPPHRTGMIVRPARHCSPPLTLTPRILTRTTFICS